MWKWYCSNIDSYVQVTSEKRGTPLVTLLLTEKHFGEHSVRRTKKKTVVVRLKWNSDPKVLLKRWHRYTTNVIERFGMNFYKIIFKTVFGVTKQKKKINWFLLEVAMVIFKWNILKLHEQNDLIIKILLYQ